MSLLFCFDGEVQAAWRGLVGSAHATVTYLNEGDPMRRNDALTSSFSYPLFTLFECVSVLVEEEER